LAQNPSGGGAGVVPIFVIAESLALRRQIDIMVLAFLGR